MLSTSYQYFHQQMKQLENSMVQKKPRNKSISFGNSLNQLKAPFMSAAASSKNKSPHPVSLFQLLICCKYFEVNLYNILGYTRRLHDTKFNQ